MVGGWWWSNGATIAGQQGQTTGVNLGQFYEADNYDALGVVYPLWGIVETSLSLLSGLPGENLALDLLETSMDSSGALRRFPPWRCRLGDSLLPKPCLDSLCESGEWQRVDGFERGKGIFLLSRYLPLLPFHPLSPCWLGTHFLGIDFGRFSYSSFVGSSCDR